MTKVKTEEIRALSNEELAKRLQEARQEVFNLRLRLASRQLEDTSVMSRSRREVARLLTLRRERAMAG